MEALKHIYDEVLSLTPQLPPSRDALRLKDYDMPDFRAHG